MKNLQNYLFIEKLKTVKRIDESSYEDLKTDKELNEKQKAVIEEIIKQVKQASSKKSSLGVIDSFIDKYGTLTCVIHGGLNGPGEWTNYLEDLTVAVKRVKDCGIHIWLISALNDCMDDVFTFNFGVSTKIS